MKLKNNYKSIFSIILFSFVFTSCQKFLDVKPRSESPEAVLFNSEDGFKDALTGVYVQMKSSNSYGKSLSYGTLECLISSWDVATNTTEDRLGKFNFVDNGVRNSFNAIFSAAYNSIANLNALLRNIDDKKSVFSSERMYKMIKGEALALRAYLHADVLRLFGPIPNNAIPANIGLPYVTELSRNINKPLSFSEYKTLLFKDLSDAETLLNDSDPILEFTITQLANPNSFSGFTLTDNYYGYRYLRMNYYAVKAEQARMYLWFGDNQQAYDAAKVVVLAKNKDNSAKFRLGVAADFSKQDFALSPEHIFGLHNFEMNKTYKQDFEGGVFKKGTSANTIRDFLYNNTGTDIREANLWSLGVLNNSGQFYYIKKYSGLNNITQMPMLRMSEMYLLLAETAPLAEAQIYWSAFKSSRNIAVTTLPESSLLRSAEVLKEFRKEFYAEGQAFYAYKRLGTVINDIVFAPVTAQVNYVAPIPEDEKTAIK